MSSGVVYQLEAERCEEDRGKLNILHIHAIPKLTA